MKPMIQLLHFYVSPAHNFYGHHDQPPGDAPVHERETIDCVEGKGIAGDRFFEYRSGYKGQITFFAMETHEMMCKKFGKELPASVYRRNVITQGFDLNELIGAEFEIQGIRFEGMEEAKPCYWMDTTFGHGAENALQGVGGLRAKILDGGELRLSRLLDSKLEMA
jgi:MOSC domain-containing protein YiiM